LVFVASPLSTLH